MKQRRIMIMTLAALGLISGSVVYGQYNSDLENLKRDNARMRLSLQESERASQDQYRRLVERITLLQDAISQAQEVVKTYQNRIAEMDKIRQEVQAENANLRQQLMGEIAALRQQLEAESKQREASMRKLAELFNQRGMAAAAAATRTAPAGEASSSAAPSAPANTAPAQNAASADGDAPSGEYFEYVVQKGATLSAVARAYKVSVDDIRKANKLNGNVIFIGQKLLIPKK